MASASARAKPAQERIAVFPGTFDPYTNGHFDLTKRAARLFDRVVVAVAHNPGKGALFAIEERVEMIQRATRGMRRVEVVDFADLVVDCARRVGAQVMIRGLRAVSDFEFEFQMALMNRRLSPRLEVAFLMPSQQYTYLNSTLVKEVARLGGSVRGLVPRSIEDTLRARLAGADGARDAAVRGTPASMASPAPAKRPRTAPGANGSDAPGRSGGAGKAAPRGAGRRRPRARGRA